ncbi:MAG: hypothetical protein GY773_01880 [Actinomycetia bacterium]|nr:hypothetical protein [Actinomycetes bacterium]
MNRAERRAQGHRGPKEPVLIVGDGVAAAALGHRYEARPHAALAPKQAGKHRWVATGAWVLSDEAVSGADDPDTMKFLDNENLMYLGIGCWDCERPLEAITKDSTCPAPGE